MIVLFEKLLIPLQVTFSCFICVTFTLTPPTSRLIPPLRQVSVISMVEFVSEEQGGGGVGGGVVGHKSCLFIQLFQERLSENMCTR